MFASWDGECYTLIMRTSPPTLLSLVVALACAIWPRASASACSLVSVTDASLPPGGATLGPRPVLITSSSEPLLLGEDDDQPIAVVRETAFDGLQYPTTTPITAWRPAEPLPVGRYRWAGAWNSGGSDTFFFVDPTLVDPTPEIKRATFHVTLTEPGGDIGCDSDSCSDVDFTKLDLDYSTSPDVVGTIVELTGDDARLLVFAKSNGPTPVVDPKNPTLERHAVSFWDGTRGFPSFKKAPVCVAITAVSANGTLSERHDLGCARPGHEGAHLSDERGCAAGRTSDPWVLILSVFFSRLANHRRNKWPSTGGRVEA